MGVANTDRQPYSKRIGGQLNLGANVSVITDSLVSGNATCTLLKAAITAAIPSYMQTKIAADVNRALDAGITQSLWTETHGLTTVAGFVALTDASTTHRQALFG